MFVCLSNGVTSQTGAEAVAAGGSTTKEVAQACAAGARLRASPASGWYPQPAYRPGDTALVGS
jgi:hypothetical protein